MQYTRPKTAKGSIIAVLLLSLLFSLQQAHAQTAKTYDSVFVETLKEDIG